MKSTNNQLADKIKRAELNHRKGFHNYVSQVSPLLQQARDEFDSQTDYAQWVEESLPFTRRQADRLIVAGDVLKKLGPIGPEHMPASESVCRELAMISDHQLINAWRDIVLIADCKTPTAKDVKHYRLTRCSNFWDYESFGSETSLEPIYREDPSYRKSGCNKELDAFYLMFFLIAGADRVLNRIKGVDIPQVKALLPEIQADSNDRKAIDIYQNHYGDKCRMFDGRAFGIARVWNMHGLPYPVATH